MPKKTKTPKTEELEAIEESEFMSDTPTKAEASAENIDEEAERSAVAEKGAGETATVPAEVEAISTANKTARELNKKVTKETKKRSVKYRTAKEFVEAGKLHTVEEAIELVKKASYTKFDGTIELHIKLNKKKNKGSTESSKGYVTLPHGTGRDKKIIVLDEDKIEQIAKTKKIDFDIALASPSLMPKLGKIAKILGPKGKMPSPSAGTVTDNPEAVIKEFSSGKIEYRIDATNNIHQGVGKISWDSAKIKENISAFIATMPKSRYAAIYLSATMGPSIKLEINSL